MSIELSKEIMGHLKEAKKLLLIKVNEGVDLEAEKDALASIKQSFSILEIYAEPEYEKPSWDGIEDTRDKIQGGLEDIDALSNPDMNPHLSDGERLDLISNAASYIGDLLGIEIQ